jgi:hypothetical protein
MSLHNRQCRACHIHLAGHGPPALAQSWVQLWLGEQLAARLQTAAGILGYRAGDKNPGRTMARQLATSPADPVSAHLLNPDQFVLFDMDRDWSRIVEGPLPTMTPAAQALVDAFDRRARGRGWPYQTRRESVRTPQLVVGWLGAEAPIHEADIRAVATHLTHARARRVVQFLRARALLIPEPAVDADHRKVEQILDGLSHPISAEVSRWVQVLRGQGRRPHPPMPWQTIRRSLAALEPVLCDWKARGSLREISRTDIDAVLRELQGQRARKMASALRSLFRALRQEPLIFTNPTRGVAVTDVTSLPTQPPLSQWLLNGSRLWCGRVWRSGRVSTPRSATPPAWRSWTR